MHAPEGDLQASGFTLFVLRSMAFQDEISILSGFSDGETDCKSSTKRVPMIFVGDPFLPLQRSIYHQCSIGLATN